jgi:hypothetical protein
MGHWIPTFKENVVYPSSKMLVVCDLLSPKNEGNVLPGNVQIQFSIYAVSNIGRMEYSQCHMFGFMIFMQDVYIYSCANCIFPICIVDLLQYYLLMYIQISEVASFLLVIWQKLCMCFSCSLGMLHSPFTLSSFLISLIRFCKEYKLCSSFTSAPCFQRPWMYFHLLHKTVKLHFCVF